MNRHLFLEESKKYGTNHLRPDSKGRLVLVIEELYGELRKAIYKITSDNHRHKIQRSLTEPFLLVPDEISNDVIYDTSTMTEPVSGAYPLNKS